MGKMLVLENGEQISAARQIGRKIAKIAISPFYRKIEEGKTSHCAISSLVESDGKTKGVAAGIGVIVRDVKGVAGGLISGARDVDGAHIGLGMAMTDNMRGFSAGLFNLIWKTNRGFAFGLIGTSVGNGIGSWRIGDYCSKGAVVGGIYASTQENTEGFVFGGLIASVGGKMRGIMAGIVNLADSFEGFRIGVINMSIGEGPSKGVEIGLLNINAENPWWAKVSPIFAIRGLVHRTEQEE